MDGVLRECSQEQVYSTCASNLVTQAMEGINGTLLAYGQAGAGMTYTMRGSLDDYQYRGIIPRAISQVFQEIRERTESSITVRYYTQVLKVILTIYLKTDN